MSELDPEVLNGVIALLVEVQGDWEFDGEIGAQTRFVADLGLESLEIVVLSTMVQQQYGKLPFPAFFDEIGQRTDAEQDVSVAELVNFVSRNRQTTAHEV